MNLKNAWCSFNRVDYHSKHFDYSKTHFLLISIYVLNLLNLHFNRLSAAGF